MVLNRISVCGILILCCVANDLAASPFSRLRNRWKSRQGSAEIVAKPSYGLSINSKGSIVGLAPIVSTRPEIEPASPIGQQCKPGYNCELVTDENRSVATEALDRIRELKRHTDRLVNELAKVKKQTRLESHLQAIKIRKRLQDIKTSDELRSAKVRMTLEDLQETITELGEMSNPTEPSVGN